MFISCLVWEAIYNQLWNNAKMATPDVKNEEKQKLMEGQEASATKKGDKKDGTRWKSFLKNNKPYM